MDEIRVFLIGGTSHGGKSTLAAALATRWGWSRVSTDGLARHPGRPWVTGQQPVPEHVRAHFRTLSTGELAARQLHHYQRRWPDVEDLIETRATDTGTEGLVLEGSGVLPERVAALRLPGVVALWLTADVAALRGRVHAASRYHQRSADEQLLVEKFLARTVRYQQHMHEHIDCFGLTSLDTSADPAVEELFQRCRELVCPQ